MAARLASSLPLRLGVSFFREQPRLFSLRRAVPRPSPPLLLPPLPWKPLHGPTPVLCLAAPRLLPHPQRAPSLVPPLPPLPPLQAALRLSPAPLPPPPPPPPPPRPPPAARLAPALALCRARAARSLLAVGGARRLHSSAPRLQRGPWPQRGGGGLPAAIPGLALPLLAALAAAAVFGALPAVLLLLLVLASPLLLLAAAAARLGGGGLLRRLGDAGAGGGAGASLGRRIASALARIAALALLRQQRSQRLLASALARRVSTSGPLAARLGARALQMAPPSQVAAGSIGVAATGFGGAALSQTRLVAPILDERSRVRAQLVVAVSVQGPFARGGAAAVAAAAAAAAAAGEGAAAAPQRRTVADNLRFFLSGDALREAEQREEAARSRRERARPSREQDGDGAGGGALSDFDELVAEDARGEGPLADESFAFRVLEAILVLPGGERLDVTADFAGELRGDDDSTGAGAGEGGAGAAGEGGARGRVFEAQWREPVGKPR